jgi:hypothetical protein
MIQVGTKTMEESRLAARVGINDSLRGLYKRHEVGSLRELYSHQPHDPWLRVIEGGLYIYHL